MALFRKYLYVLLLLMLFHGTSSAQGRIAFYSHRDGNAEIYVMNFDGTDPERLTFDNGKDVCPDWSPDGKRIVFLSDRDGDNEIYVMNDQGGDLQKLTDNDGYEMHPDWSPDGKRIAFVSKRDGNDEIYVMDADGNNPVRLTQNSAQDMRPDWSPDGTKIIFNSHRDGNWEIYMMNADGTDPERLTDTSDAEIFPAWSPDGAKIAYRGSPTPQTRGHIFVMNTDGGGKEQITFHPEGEEDPVWSSDGKKIIFQSTQHNNFELYKVNAHGGNVERLTFEPAGDYWPSCARNWGRLEATPTKIPASIGAVVDFRIEAGQDKAGCWYILLAGISGMGPGIHLPGGSLMPLEWDSLTSIVAYAAQSEKGFCMSNFYAQLDAQGGSLAELDTQGPLDPLLVGLVLHFSYAVKTPPWWAASNAVAIEIVP